MSPERGSDPAKVSTLRFTVNVTLVTSLAIAGLVLTLLAGEGVIGRKIWMPLGIAMMAFGAVGVLVVIMIKAYRTERQTAHPPDLP